MFSTIIFILSLQLSRINSQEVNTDRIACDGMIFNDVYFKKETLFKDLGRPYNLVVHKFSGTLFFSHTIQNGTHVDFLISACVVASKKCRVVPGVPGGYAIAYDVSNDDIYLGGHDGIYKYNFLTKSADFFAEQGKSIWSLFVKKHFYYIEYPSQKLYVYQNDEFVKVAEASKIEIDNFFISKQNSIYFSNKTAIFKVERPKPDVVMLDDTLVVRQIVEDFFSDVYFVASDGIYLEEKPFQRLRKIADVEQAFSLTFDDKDNVIFSDSNAIYKLMPSDYAQLCYDALKSLKEQEKNVGRISSKLMG